MIEMKNRHLITLCLLFAGWNSSLPLHAQTNDAKGLAREGAPKAEAAAQPADDTATPTASVLLRNFPDPSVELPPEEDSASKKPDTSTRLQAIISTTRLSPWDRFTKLGNEAFFQGLYGDAEKQFMAAIRELKKTNIKDERLIRSRNNLGAAYLREGKYADAKQAFELARQTEQELGLENSIESARSLAGLASVFRQTGQFDKAETMYKESLAMRQKLEGTNTLGVAQGLLDLGELYRQQKLYSDAEPVYQLALETLNKAKEVPELTKAYFLDRTGQLFHDQGKMPEAKRCFETALLIKDKYATLYTPVDPRKRGLVYYRCINGIPNAAKVFTRGMEVECLHVKDVMAVATMATQVYGPDWQLLKAEVTILNQGKTAVMALPEQPPFFMELPRERVLTPLSSDAIAAELGVRGRLIYNRLLHSADFAYVVNSYSGASSTVVSSPFTAPAVINTIGGWTTVTPDWQARAAARNAAIGALSAAVSESNAVLKTKPDKTTIAPGEAATFDIFYPYRRFESGILRFMVGNTVLEFPFGAKSG